VVENALEDDRFADNPVVTGPLNIRFYAGAVLSIQSEFTKKSVNLGTLCVMDREPRSWSQQDSEKLKSYAQQISAELSNYNHCNYRWSKENHGDMDIGKPTDVGATPLRIPERQRSGIDA
jgi:GAF domain-containing protein